jgi:hypothetical protein
LTTPPSCPSSAAAGGGVGRHCHIGSDGGSLAGSMDRETAQTPTRNVRNKSKSLDSFATPSAAAQKEMQAKPAHRDTVFARDEETWMSRRTNSATARYAGERRTAAKPSRKIVYTNSTA